MGAAREGDGDVGLDGGSGRINKKEPLIHMSLIHVICPRSPCPNMPLSDKAVRSPDQSSSPEVELELEEERSSSSLVWGLNPLGVLF